MEIRPTSITVKKQDRKVYLHWSDDHVSEYSLSLLRNAYPCVTCRGGHERMSSTPDLIVFSLPDIDTPQTRLMNIEAVGTNAIIIEWEDGHHFGIYTWQYLRNLCPCEECRSRKG